MSTILVIGASRGIGLEFARQYRGDWDRVFATARDESGLERIEELGATAMRLDVTEPEALERVRDQLQGEKIDIAIYVAGVYARGRARQALLGGISIASCTPTCWARCRRWC
jgi:short-subunit dehydrogenase